MSKLYETTDKLDSGNSGISFFERYLTIWVALCIIAGVAIGQYVPGIPNTLAKFEYYQVSIPVAILI